MRSNWLDRAIGAVAPNLALRRLNARAALDVATRRYDGAAVGRHTDGWIAGATAADTELMGARGRLRDRARDLVRNNPHAARAIAAHANNIIGSGIVPRPDTGSEAKNKKIRKAFDRWAKQCDARGLSDFYGLQTLAMRQIVEAGEVLSRRRWRKPDDLDVAPVQIQLLEADYLDDSKNGDAANGNLLIQGIEFDAIGRRQAYHLWRQHPGNNVFSARQSLTSAPVPAEDVAHAFEQQRTQERGASWFAPVMRTLRDLDDYDFAERVRKKMEASMVGVVTADADADMGINPDGSVPEEGPLGVTDRHGNPIERFEPGMFAYARGGKSIQFNSPSVVAGYSDARREHLRTSAAGLRLTYELLTGDLSQVNFSSMRGGRDEYRTFVGFVQWHIVIPMLLEPWWAWFCTAAFIAGEIDDPVVPVQWGTPKFRYVDPVSDNQATQIGLRTGAISFREMCLEDGVDPTERLDDVEWFQKECAKRGVTLDSDPGQTSGKGVSQKVDPATGRLVPGNTDPAGDDVGNGNS